MSVHQDTPHNTKRYNLMSVKMNKIVLPRDSITLDTTLPNQTVLIKGWNACHWPEPHITKVNDRKIQVINTSNNPVILRENRVNSIKVTSTNNTDWKPLHLSTIATQPRKSSTALSDSETLYQIDIGKTSTDIKDLLDAAHRQFRKVFNNDLTGGYNGYFGHHSCKLN